LSTTIFILKTYLVPYSAESTALAMCFRPVSIVERAQFMGVAQTPAVETIKHTMNALVVFAEGLTREKHRQAG